MSYFLRVRKYKKGNYLSIVDSKHVTGKKHNQSKVYKTLGYEKDLITDEIKDPIEFYKNECKKLNSERNADKSNGRETIADVSPNKNLGYFLPKKVINKLNFKLEFKAFERNNSTFKCDIYRIYLDLVYSRIVQPESKYRTYTEVIKSLYGTKTDYSLDDVYNALSFLGTYYENIIAFLTYHTNQLLKLDTKSTLFDCTNFYFEINREDDFRKKGPSKENRKDPLVGMALLLDRKAIPIDMTLYSGNESEIPKLPEILAKMKQNQRIEGRTIQIADKGLNCGKNVVKALLNKDGYLFSKSIAKSSEKEKKWYERDAALHTVKDDAGNVIFEYKDWIDNFEYEYKDDDGTKKKITVKEKRIVTYNPKLAAKKLAELNKIENAVNDLLLSKAKKEKFGPYSEYIDLKAFNSDGELIQGKIKGFLNKEKLEEARKFAGYNLLVTSESEIDSKEIYNLYHQLWKIEHTFRVMKTDLEARPVYLQKESTIKGHFLIIYTAVLLIRILETHYLNGKVNSNDLFNFIRQFNVIELESGEFANLLTSEYLIKDIVNKVTQIKYKYLKKKEVEELLGI